MKEDIEMFKIEKDDDMKYKIKAEKDFERYYKKKEMKEDENRLEEVGLNRTLNTKEILDEIDEDVCKEEEEKVKMIEDGVFEEGREKIDKVKKEMRIPVMEAKEDMVTELENEKKEKERKDK